jgi:hypothetical protein
LLELNLDLRAASEALQDQSKALETLKPSQMNRLQRSMVRGRLPALAKDSTTHVTSFLAYVIDTVRSYLEQNINKTQYWKVRQSDNEHLIPR